MEQEIDLKEILKIIKKRWLLFVVFPLLATLISGLINFYVLKPIYESSTTLIVGRKATGLEEQFELLEDSTLDANRQLARTYGEIAKSRTVREKVIAELKLNLTADQLASKINVSLVEDTEILKIAVTDPEPQLAAEIANVMVQKFSEAVIAIKKVDSVSIVDKAVVPTTPIKPKKMLNIAIAFIGGVVSAFVLSLLLEYLDNTIENSKEAEEILGLPVLGVILDYKFDKVERRDQCPSTG